MPNPLAITLHASAAVSSAGTGTVVDVGVRTYTELQLDVTAIAGTLAITIESSPTQSSWLALGFFKNITEMGARTLIVPDGHRYLRAKWTITGTATFSITGSSHQLYATPADVARVGMAKAALEAIPVADVATACLNASSEAEGYLAAANTLPITSVDAATRQHIARMAVFELFRFRSKAASGGVDPMLEIGRSDALTWLNRVATGKLRPPGLVDATPDTQEVGSATDLYVISGPPRRW